MGKQVHKDVEFLVFASASNYGSFDSLQEALDYALIQSIALDKSVAIEVVCRSEAGWVAANKAGLIESKDTKYDPEAYAANKFVVTVEAKGKVKRAKQRRSRTR